MAQIQRVRESAAGRFRLENAGNERMGWLRWDGSGVDLVLLVLCPSADSTLVNRSAFCDNEENRVQG